MGDGSVDVTPKVTRPACIFPQVLQVPGTVLLMAHPGELHLENPRLIQFQINHNFSVLCIHARPFARVHFSLSFTLAQTRCAAQQAANSDTGTSSSRSAFGHGVFEPCGPTMVRAKAPVGVVQIPPQRPLLKSEIEI